jgi:hypothetical protein
MRPDLDLSDVALVSSLDMAVPMHHLIDAGRGLVLLDGMSAAEMRAVDAAVWDEFSCSVDQRVAVLVRFRCLVQVFECQRLKLMLLNTGFNLLAPALHVAATLRLNADRGFNPVKFERALREAMARLHGREMQGESAQPLAA